MLLKLVLSVPLYLFMVATREILNGIRDLHSISVRQSCSGQPGLELQLTLLPLRRSALAGGRPCLSLGKASRSSWRHQLSPWPGRTLWVPGPGGHWVPRNLCGLKPDTYLNVHTGLGVPCVFVWTHRWSPAHRMAVMGGTEHVQG